MKFGPVGYLYLRALLHHPSPLKVPRTNVQVVTEVRARIFRTNALAIRLDLCNRGAEPGTQMALRAYSG